MRKYRVFAEFVGEVDLGEFLAATREEAIELARNSDKAENTRRRMRIHGDMDIWVDDGRVPE